MDSFWFESFIYLSVVGPVQFMGSAILCLFLCPLCVRHGFRGQYREFLGSLLLLNLVLLFWGDLAHYIWLKLTFFKLYVSGDRLVDWWPFIPFGEWVIARPGIDGQPGYLLNGASVPLLRLIWASLATSVWLLSWLSVRLIRYLSLRSIPQNRP